MDVILFRSIYSTPIFHYIHDDLLKFMHYKFPCLTITEFIFIFMCIIHTAILFVCSQIILQFAFIICHFEMCCNNKPIRFSLSENSFMHWKPYVSLRLMYTNISLPTWLFHVALQMHLFWRSRFLSTNKLVTIAIL